MRLHSRLDEVTRVLPKFSRRGSLLIHALQENRNHRQKYIDRNTSVGIGALIPTKNDNRRYIHVHCQKISIDPSKTITIENYLSIHIIFVVQNLLVPKLGLLSLANYIDRDLHQNRLYIFIGMLC